MSSNTHELKILPQWFADVSTGKKNFEIRRNDRDFKVGDYLLLKEYERGHYTGRELKKRIQYIYQGDGNYGLSEEFCILGLEDRPTGEWLDGEKVRERTLSEIDRILVSREIDLETAQTVQELSKAYKNLEGTKNG
jgi:hypothetical protein